MLNKNISSTKGFAILSGYMLALTLVLSVIHGLHASDWVELSGLHTTQATVLFPIGVHE